MTSRTGPLLSDALFRTLAESTSAAVFVIARDRFQYVNPALAALAGCSVEQLLASNPYDLIHPDSLPEALRRLSAARAGNSIAPRWEVKIWNGRGHSVSLLLAMKVIEVGGDLLTIGVGVDVPSAKVPRPEWSLPDRDAAAQLARGLAHDLNDLLQVIQGHAELYGEGPSAEGRVEKNARAIRDAADRAAALTHELLAFSRRLAPDGDAGPPIPMRPVVLLVEDEEPVRELIAQMLERDGFDVVKAASGEEGLRIEQDRRVDLVLSDVMLPGCNGFQMASQIRRRSPHVRVIFMSGFTGEAIAGDAGLDPRTPLIQKPFKMADLVRRIRDVLKAPIGDGTMN